MEPLLPREMETKAIQLLSAIEIEKLNLRSIYRAINKSASLNEALLCRGKINGKRYKITQLNNELNKILNMIPGEKLIKMLQ